MCFEKNEEAWDVLIIKVILKNDEGKVMEKIFAFAMVVCFYSWVERMQPNLMGNNGDFYDYKC